MSKIPMTNRRLAEVVEDMQRQSENSPAFALLHHAKLASFFSQNAIRLNRLQEKQKQLVDRYVWKGEDGQPMTEEKDGQKLWQFADQETKDTYLAELNAFMGTTVDVYL